MKTVMITSPAHYKDVRGYLNRNLPQRWIGRAGKEEDALMRWPPRSPYLTPCEFFFWGFVKDTVFVPPLPANLQEEDTLMRWPPRSPDLTCASFSSRGFVKDTVFVPPLTANLQEEDALMRWPPRSPDLTLCDYFSSGVL
jgi:hypothetical protein